MRIKKILLGLMMVAALLILARPTISNAVPYSGAWLPYTDISDPEIFVADLTLQLGLGSFYIYDRDNTPNVSDDLLVLEDGFFSARYVDFEEDAFGDWSASLYGGGDTLNLGPSPEFGFYFANSDGTYTEYNLELNSTNNAYILTDNLSTNSTGMIVMVSDAAPVPIPASVLLLGSGILGLITIGRVGRKDS